MSVLDVRDDSTSPIEDILFSDNQFISLEEEKIAICDSEEETSVYILIDDIPYLVKALQIARGHYE